VLGFRSLGVAQTARVGGHFTVKGRNQPQKLKNYICLPHAMPDLSVVVSYYKAPHNLVLILDALAQQSFTHFEVIVSEDDHNTETIQFIEHNRSKYPYPLVHNYQSADLGFRKNQMLNRAIRSASANKLAFLDGDCLPHKHWAARYVQHVQPGRIAIGRSVMLNEKFTRHIYQTRNLANINLPAIWLSQSQKKKEALYWPWFPIAFNTRKGLVGRNWGILKTHLIEVNGFDEDYQLPAVGEDVDIEWRLLQHGLARYSMKNKAIAYHLYHPRQYSQTAVQKNYALFDQKKQLGHIACLNGLHRLNNNQT